MLQETEEIERGLPTLPSLSKARSADATQPVQGAKRRHLISPARKGRERITYETKGRRPDTSGRASVTSKTKARAPAPALATSH